MLKRYIPLYILCRPRHICPCSFYLWVQSLEAAQSSSFSTWGGCNLPFPLCCAVGPCLKSRHRWTLLHPPFHTRSNFLCSPSVFLQSSSWSCHSRYHFWSHRSDTWAPWNCLWSEAPSPDCSMSANSDPRTPFHFNSWIINIYLRWIRDCPTGLFPKR